jgi:hypothetical protein
MLDLVQIISLTTDNADDKTKKEQFVSAVENALPVLGDDSDTFLMFFKLISEGQFPVTNIALQLYLDVVRLHESRTNNSPMKCTDEVKQFWAIGYRLFKGKFVHFMRGGSTEENDCHDFGINFARKPSANVLWNMGIYRSAVMKNFGNPQQMFHAIWAFPNCCH